MNKLFIILLFFVSVPLFGQHNNYYVDNAADGGDDAHAGTSISEPWATWQKSFDTAEAGDTVFFRGGVWLPTTTASSNGNHVTYIDPTASDYPQRGHNGTASHPIVYMAYNNEIPILDCSLITTSGNFQCGISGFSIQYIKFIGLTVRNVFQRASNVTAYGINIYGGFNCTLERLTVYNIGGKCIYYGQGLPGLEGLIDTSYIRNCDVYNACDTFAVIPGNGADGFKLDNWDSCHIMIYGNRAWNVADDGFDVSGWELDSIANNWSFNNGMSTGNGVGFKLSAQSRGDTISRIVVNNISALNTIGIDENIGNTAAMNGLIYNNISYGNNVGYANQGIHTGDNKTNIYRNNISYKDTVGQELYNLYTYLIEHCTFRTLVGAHPYTETNPDYTVTDADFVSLDVGQLDNARHADGSLPDITFGRLANDSDLRSAGVNVGMTATPDIGIDWAYLDAQSAPDVLVTGITVTGAGSATTITTNDGTLQLTATIVPDTATLQTVTWSIADGTGHGHISVGGLVTAVTDGTATATATANDGSAVHGHLELTFSNQDATTIPVVPTTAFPSATNIRVGASGGNVTGDGGATVTDRGVCWNTSTNPTTANAHVHASGTTGSFTSAISGLVSNTTYYVRSWATNSQGTSYGPNETFKTPYSSTAGSASKIYVHNGKTIVLR
jgi:hypothetical protein